MQELLQQEILSIGNWTLIGRQLIELLLFLVACYIGLRFIKARWRLSFYKKFEIHEPAQRTFEKFLRQLLLFTALLGLISILRINFIFYSGKDGESAFDLRVGHIIIALIILVCARITDWVISNIIIHQYNEGRREEPIVKRVQNQTSRVDHTESVATKTVQYIVYVLSAILIIRNFGLDFNFFPSSIGEDAVDFRLSSILFVILIFLVARMVVWLITQIFLFGIYRRNRIDQGSQFAINQILKYVIYLFAIIMALRSLGIDMTLLIGGAAALLVGIGLGLQQTFNDFFSGLVLLFERSVSVGDVLEVNGTVGSVKKIGLRASILQTRPNVALVIPNSKLVNDNVYNWTHYTVQARFDVGVGVAYGSDTTLVKKLLLKAVMEHPLVLEYPSPFVRFNNFGESALDFNVYFFTTRFLIIEDIKSDIRLTIDRLFRENNITVPFPQRDVWIKKEENE